MFDDDDFGDDIERTGATEQGLDEVERALSVLGGRHPEVVRAEREARESTERRLRELRAQAEIARKRSRRRAIFATLSLVAVGTLGFFGFRRFQNQRAQSARVEPATAGYLARGFTLTPRSLLARENEADADVQDGMCVVVALALDANNTAVNIDHGGKVDVAKGSAIFCTCASEHVHASAEAPVRILTIADASIGGLRAIDWLDPRPPVVLPSGDECAPRAFAAWVTGPRAPQTTPSEVPNALAEVGFVAIGGSKPPFTVVHGAAENSCFLATSRSSIALEAADGTAVIRGSSLAWCDGASTLHVLSGTEAIAVVAAPLRRVGGMLGLREVVGKAGVHDLVTWISDDDLGRVAVAQLQTLVVPDPASVKGTLRKDVSKNARVVSFVVRGGGTGSPDELGNAPTYDADPIQGAFFACEPAATDALESVCVESEPLTWKPHGSASVSAAAYGPLPFWMSAIDSTTTRELVSVKLAMLRLARRLVARGFDPTIIEGVTEKPRGVEILGRSGEDAVIAVGLWPSPPWAVPYSNGAPWTLDDPSPRAIPIQGGARISLEAPMTPTATEKVRRTVVFRHAIVPHSKL